MKSSKIEVNLVRNIDISLMLLLLIIITMMITLMLVLLLLMLPLIKVIKKWKVVVHLKKNRSSYTYCLPHFLFGAKNPP